ncbi:MAG: hypothetical protein ABIQ51_20225 [Mesorhizobium sp.]
MTNMEMSERQIPGVPADLTPWLVAPPGEQERGTCGRICSSCPMRLRCLDDAGDADVSARPLR